MIRRVRKLLGYFGLDGSATKRDWVRAAVEVLPPLVASTLAVELVGAGGLTGWGLWLLFGVLAWVLWWPLVVLLAPWRRS